MSTIDLITDKVLHVYAWSLLIATCYIFPLFYLKVYRKGKTCPAKISEKMYTWFCSIIILSFGLWMYAGNFANELSEFLSDFIITVIPVSLGIHHAFQKDAKLTLKDRRRIKYEIDDSEGRDELS